MLLSKYITAVDYNVEDLEDLNTEYFAHRRIAGYTVMGERLRVFRNNKYLRKNFVLRKLISPYLLQFIFNSFYRNFFLHSTQNTFISHNFFNFSSRNSMVRFCLELSDLELFF